MNVAITVSEGVVAKTTATSAKPSTEVTANKASVGVVAKTGIMVAFPGSIRGDLGTVGPIDLPITPEGATVRVARFCPVQKPGRATDDDRGVGTVKVVAVLTGRRFGPSRGQISIVPRVVVKIPDTSLCQATTPTIETLVGGGRVQPALTSESAVAVVTPYAKVKNPTT